MLQWHSRFDVSWKLSSNLGNDSDPCDPSLKQMFMSATVWNLKNLFRDSR